MLLSILSPLMAQYTIDLESGGVFSGYNYARIPNETGTKISFVKDLDTPSSLFFRMKLGYQLNDKHNFTLLIAPLTLHPKGRINNDVYFEGVNFPANVDIDAIYKFNSYRIAYRYDLIRMKKLELGLGLTIKVRDAKIALESAELQSEKTDLGLVPLVNFNLLWRFQDRWGILLEAEALGSTQGRAEDILLAVDYRLTDNFRARIGYRFLEGGADVDSVYNFTLLNYILLGINVSF